MSAFTIFTIVAFVAVMFVWWQTTREKKVDNQQPSTGNGPAVSQKEGDKPGGALEFTFLAGQWYMCIRNYSSYWIAVYQGDGKFLVSGYEGTKYEGVIYDGITTITKGQNYWLQWDAKNASVDFLKSNPTLVAANAAGGDYIQDWQCVVVMRPSRGFTDINVQAAMS